MIGIREQFYMGTIPIVVSPSMCYMGKFGLSGDILLSTENENEFELEILRISRLDYF